MVGRYAVPGCKSTYYKGNQKENEITLFAIPKNSLSQWQELIPCSNLTSTSRICSRHFDESDFKTGIEILNVFHPYKKWTLNAEAIPKYFLLNDPSSRQALKNVDVFKLRNNLNVEANASVRKRPKLDTIPSTSKEKKVNSRPTESSMEATSTVAESYKIQHAAEHVAVVIEDSTVVSRSESSMEATSTAAESYKIQHAAEEETFSLLPDSIETNVAVVIEDSTVVSRSESSMEATSTAAESYNIQHASEHVAVVIEDSTVVSRSESSMEATSTAAESYNIQHAAEEETFSLLPDSIETNVAVVIEDSTVAHSMASISTMQESYNMQHAAEEETCDPLSDSIETNVAVVIEDSTVAPSMAAISTMQESYNMQHAAAEETFDQSTVAPSMAATSSNFKSNFVTFQSLVTLSIVPKNWMWSFDQIKQMIFCISLDHLQNGNLNIKCVRFQNKQEVMYYVNGKIIPSSTTTLSNHFTTIEDISQLIKNFNDQKICCGIPQEKFRNVNYSSRLSGTLDSAGVLRSKFCTTISEKNIVCVKCLYLKKYLYKKLREVEVKKPISKDKKTKFCKLAEKQMKLDICRKAVKVLKGKQKDACKLIKDLRRECQIMIRKEKTNGLDYQLRHLSETVNNEEETFQMCIDKISTCHLVPIFCDIHRDEKLPYVIREFVGVRYYFESKRLKNLLLAKASANVKTNKKLAKLA